MSSQSLRDTTFRPANRLWLNVDGHIYRIYNIRDILSTNRHISLSLAAAGASLHNHLKGRPKPDPTTVWSELARATDSLTMWPHEPIKFPDDMSAPTRLNPSYAARCG